MEELLQDIVNMICKNDIYNRVFLRLEDQELYSFLLTSPHYVDVCMQDEVGAWKFVKLMYGEGCCVEE